MKILQLCCVSNHWASCHEVTNIDIQMGIDVLALSDDYGKNYDLVVAAPPCDQFTKSNSHAWDYFPEYYIKIAEKCLTICINSGKPWFLENPPGRIEKLIPGLRNYRIQTWQGTLTNKEYVIYSNILILSNKVSRYGKKHTISNWSKLKREEWQIDFIHDIARTINVLQNN